MRGVSTATDALHVLRIVIYRLSCGMMHVYLERVSRDGRICSDVGPCGYQTAGAPPRRFHIQGSSRQHRNARLFSLTATIQASSCPLHPYITHTAIMMNFVLSLLLQLSMFMLAEAAPITAQSAKPWQAGTGGGIIGFIVLVLDIIAWSK